MHLGPTVLKTMFQLVQPGQQIFWDRGQKRIKCIGGEHHEKVLAAVAFRQNYLRHVVGRVGF